MLNIALNTYREIVRSHIFGMILFFAGVFLVFSLALDALSLGASDRVIRDFGLGMIEIFGIIGVVFIGSQLLYKEIEGKTIFLLLSKPISRRDFIMGKYMGFSAVILGIIFFQAIVYLGVLLFQGILISDLVIWSLFFTFLKLEVLLALVFFFSSFMGNMLTIVVSLMIYLIAHSLSIFLDMFSKLGNELIFFTVRVFQILLPPLEAMNIKDVIGTFEILETQYFIFNMIHASVYIVLILCFTIYIFNKKDFQN